MSDKEHFTNPVAVYEDTYTETFKQDGDKEPKESNEQTKQSVSPSMGETEIRAREDGWVNREEWTAMGKDPEDHVSAREFNRAGELFARIKSQSGQINTLKGELTSTSSEIAGLKETLEQLIEHNRKMAEHQVDSVKRDLQAQRASAITEGDTTKLVEIETALDKLREPLDPPAKISTEEAPKEGPSVLSEEQIRNKLIFDQWTHQEENQWFYKDVALKGAFISLGDEIFENNPNIPFIEVLNQAKKELVRQYPAKFGAKAPPPGSKDTLEGDSTQNSSGKFTEADLDPEQRQVGMNFVKHGAFKNIQEYVDQLASMGELG